MNLGILSENPKDNIKLDNVEAIIDTGAGWNVIIESLINKVPNPFYLKKNGEIIKCAGFGLGSSHIYGKLAMIDVEIPNICEERLGHIIRHQVFVVSDEVFSDYLKRKDIKLILGNPWLDWVGAIIKNSNLIECFHKISSHHQKRID